MSDYTIIENLSEEEILNLYDEVVEISAYQSDCHCVCNDGAEGYYTGYHETSCPKNSMSRSGVCKSTFCNEHGGINYLNCNPDSLECCQYRESCWRYSGRVINWL